MPYIDHEYYYNVYNGKHPNDDKELPKLIQRASEVVDNLTGYKLANGLIRLDDHKLYKDRVQLATAKIVEHYIINGGYEAIKQQELGSVQLGSFSYSKATNRQDAVETDKKEFPDEVISILSSVGLLYSGIEVL